MRVARYSLLCAAFLLYGPLSAQVYSIAAPELTICSGVVHDAGGAGASYGNNEFFTTTICPDQEGTWTSLEFLLFNLSTEGAAPGDVLRIHDGATTDAPLMGTYGGTQLQGLVVTASSLNVSGCLTLTFTSNNSGAGDFAMAVSCSLPCAAPSALWAASMPDTITLCQGAELVLDAGASVPAPGRILARYIWYTGNALPDTTNSPQQPLVLAEGGPVQLWLQVVDDLGCPSAPSDAILALVAETPSFLGTIAPSAVCVPGAADLVGQAAVLPLIDEQTACLDFGSGAYLPDDIAQPFISQQVIGPGSPGQLIMSAADLGDICLTIEHSYMGDLLVELECPNGQSVRLHDQGGSSTYLGQANDNITGPSPSPGICWNYCFNADPDHSTWVASSQFGSAPNVISVQGGVALAPGSYTSVESLDSLIGCPLNGLWTLRITDLLGADNGFLCGWCIDSPLEPDSSLAALSPTLALDVPDSAYWSGSAVGNDPFAPTATASVSEVGAHAYTFTVVDSYGCLHDTTVVVQGLAPTMVDAGPDVTLCADSVQLNVAVGSGSTATCNYTLEMYDQFGDPWSGATVSVILDGDTSVYSHQLFTEMQSVSIPVSDGMAIELYYSAAAVFNLENSFALFDADGNLVHASPQGPITGTAYTGFTACSGVGSPFGNVQWTPPTGLSDPSSLTPMLFTNSSGWYSVTVAPQELPACSGTDSIWVQVGTPPLDLAWNADNGTLCTNADTLFSFAWWLNGTLQTTTTTNCISNPAVGSWTVIGTGSAECPYVSDAVLVCPSITLEQNGDLVLAVGATGTWAWTLDGVPIPDATGAIITVQGNGMYTATVTTALGCVVTDSVEVDNFISIEEHGAGRLLRVFPIPNSGAFTVLADGLRGPMVTMRLTDMTGRMVHTTTATTANGSLHAQLMVNVPPGCYLLAVGDVEEERLRRIVIH